MTQAFFELSIRVLAVIHCLSLTSQAIVWRGDVKEIEEKATGEMKQVGKVYYSPLPIFGGSCVALGGRWVLTSRHGTEMWTAGTLRVDFPALGKEKHNVKRIILCPDGDLALMELANPVKGAEKLALYERDQERGKRAWIGGCGLSGPVGNLKNIGDFRAGHNRVDGLRNGRLSIRLSAPDADDCVKDEALIAVFDSGSPLFLKAKDGWRLAGIASTVSNRGNPKYGDRGNYARISSHIDWLQKVLGTTR